MKDERKVLIYCRESRDEGNENYERIETQRDMLLRFCQNRNMTNIVDVVMDDDVSGTSFRRFEGIIRKIEQGRIEVIVFKDSSRLGRNLRESLNFIAMLEEYGVEILFESEEYNEDFFPLLAWFNEQRAKEDSRKIRRVFRHKMETGELLVRCPYGYRKSPSGSMLPEPEESRVVKEIYRLFLEGRPCGEIASLLNGRSVPTPSQAAGLKKQAAAWNSQHIRRILQNNVYCGVMTYGKRTHLSFKNKRLVSRSPEDWIVRPGHHEAIVSEADFRVVQQRWKTQPDARPAARQHLFSGLLRCGRCGSHLVFRARPGRSPAYICGKNHREGAPRAGGAGCCSHRLKEELLNRALREYLRLLFSRHEMAVRETLERLCGLSPLAAERREWEEKQKSAAKVLAQIYEDRLQGRIPPELFEQKAAEYQEKQRQAERELSFLAERPEPPLPRTPEELIAALPEEPLTRAECSVLFREAVFFLPGEYAGQDGWNLKEEQRRALRTCGGLVFVEDTPPLSPLSVRTREDASLDRGPLTFTLPR